MFFRQKTAYDRRISDWSSDVCSSDLRRVPAHLVPFIGKRFIKRSLGVTGRAEAKKLRTIEDLKTDALFAVAERSEAVPASGAGMLVPARFSLAVLTEHARSTVERPDKGSAESQATAPPADRAEVVGMRRNADEKRKEKG